MKDEESTDSEGRVTRLLRCAGAGDAAASAELLELIYEQLGDLARRVFSDQGHGVTIQPTVLVHDAFLKLVNPSKSWNDRQHFFAVAAVAMRNTLRDRARASAAQKRGGDLNRVSLSGVEDSPGQGGKEVDLVRLDAALERLASLSERQARIVELRFFTGLAVAEISNILEVSVATVGNEWRAARAFLNQELS